MKKSDLKLLSGKVLPSYIEIKGYTGPAASRGTAVWSYAVVSSVGRELWHAWGYIGENVTHYYAEYRALLEALKLVEAQQWQSAVIQTELVVLPHQLSEEWIAPNALLPFREEAVRLLEKTKSRVEWSTEKGEENRARAYAWFAYEKAQLGLLTAHPLILLSSISKDASSISPGEAQTKPAAPSDVGAVTLQSEEQQLSFPNL